MNKAKAGKATIMRNGDMRVIPVTLDPEATFGKVRGAGRTGWPCTVAMPCCHSG
jgi:hypothetical protein